MIPFATVPWDLEGTLIDSEPVANDGLELAGLLGRDEDPRRPDPSACGHD